MEAASIVDASRLFRRLSPAARARLGAKARLLAVPAKATIFRQGDPCPGLLVVGRGLVRVFKLAPNGKEHVLHLAGPGASFAEAAVLGDFPCPAFAEAVEDSEVALVPADDFRAFLAGDHQACIDLLAGMAVWLHSVVDLMEDLVLRDAAGRVARQLLEACDQEGSVILSGARKHLASRLNLTPETLSRSLRRFLDAGLVEDDGEGLRVADAAGLRRIADGA